MASWHKAVARSPRTALALALATSIPVADALAQDGPVSVDPEFVNPNFGRGMIPGVNIPEADVRNTLRWGAVFQYERNPVTGYRLDVERAQIVANRLAGHFGFSWDFTSWGTAHLVVPMAVNWGSEIPEFQADGFGLGDINLGLQLLPFQSKHFNLGVNGDVYLPTGQPRAYIGEGTIRGSGGLTFMGKVGIGKSAQGSVVTLDVTGDAKVLGRSKVLVTGHDFDKGSELWLSEAARLRLTWLKVPIAFTQALIARGGFTNFFQGGAENGLEVYGGLQVPIQNIAFNTDMNIDVMAGRGTNQGYCTTDFRMLAGLTFSRNPGRKPKPVAVVVETPPPVVPPVVVEEEPPPDAIAVRREDRIEIRDPIQFFVATADIKPESQPTLQAVADIINADGRIKHLVIEGHASEEGSFEYNYELSKSRAESIYKQLILNGVAPDRMSYRGMGETRPKAAGETEEAWEVNRRVEFKIVAQYGPEERGEKYAPTTKLPWNGEETRVITPPSPEEIEEQKLRALYEKQRHERFEDVQEEEVHVEGQGAAPAPAPTPETPATGPGAPPAPEPQTTAPTRPRSEASEAIRGKRFDAPIEEEEVEVEDAAPAPAPAPSSPEGGTP
jgi:outer membrane protein OmpA-like peptidoglycan-associated protein